MGIGEVAGSIVVLAIIIWGGFEIYDYIQVSRGVFPKKSDTTLEDIKRMRDSGYESYAVRRFRQLPENKRVYTLYGAVKQVKEL